MIPAAVELLRARQRWGLSLDELASRTKIPVDRLTAIEQAHADQLWDRARLCGYVSTFAEKVGLDPIDVSERYMAQLRDASALDEFDLEESGDGNSPFSSGAKSANTIIVELPSAAGPKPSPLTHSDNGNSAQQQRATYKRLWSLVPAAARSSLRQAPHPSLMILAVTLTTGLLALAVFQRRGGGPVINSPTLQTQAQLPPSGTATGSTRGTTKRLANASDGPAPVEERIVAGGAVPTPAPVLPPAKLPQPSGLRSQSDPARLPPVISLSSTSSGPSIAAAVSGRRPPARRAEKRIDESGDGVPSGEGHIAGWWMVTNRIDQSRLASFNDLTLGFHLKLDQNGNRVRGHGVKWHENGRRVAERARTPISVDGTMVGDRLELSFTERGMRRTSHGSFEMQLADDGSLRGRFSSDAARSSGSSEAIRMPQPN